MLNLSKELEVLNKAGIEYKSFTKGDGIAVDFVNQAGKKISMFFDKAINGINPIKQTTIAHPDGKVTRRTFNLGEFSPKVTGGIFDTSKMSTKHLERCDDVFVDHKFKSFAVTKTAYGEDALLGGKAIPISIDKTKFVKNGAVQSHKTFNYTQMAKMG